MASRKKQVASKKPERKKQTPSKMSKRKNKAATKDNAPKIGAPYFAHEILDPTIYPENVRQPVGGPSPNTARLELEGDETDFTMPDVDSEADEESDTFVKAHKADKRPPSPVSPPRDVKRIRIEGGRAPAPKRILAELNSDDELIVRMKGERFTDKQIAARLREEGRVDYHYKTISSRWVRLKRALEQKQDQDLDDQLTDWHEGDDYVLLQAISAADREVYRLKQAAQEKKWRIVSMQMRNIKPGTNYSKNACRSRFEALENETATIPPELDDNPEQRATRCKEAKQNAQEKIAKRRAERVEEFESANVATGASKSKKNKAVVAASPTTSGSTTAPGSVIKTRPVRNSLPVNYAVDLSDEDSSESGLGSSLEELPSPGDEALFPGKPTGLVETKPVKNPTRDSAKPLVNRAKEVLVSQESSESLFSSEDDIITSIPERLTSQNKDFHDSSQHQTIQVRSNPTQEDDITSTASGNKAATQGSQCFQNVPAHQQRKLSKQQASTSSVTSSGGEVSSRNTSKLPTVSKELDNPKITANPTTEQCAATVGCPLSSETVYLSASVAGQQSPRSSNKEDTSKVTAAKLLLELHSRARIQQAMEDQPIEGTEETRAGTMHEYSTADRGQPEDWYYSKTMKYLLKKLKKHRLPIWGNKEEYIARLKSYYARTGVIGDPDTDTDGSDEPDHGHARKRSKQFAATTHGNVAAGDFAGTEQTDRGESRKDPPLPHIGFGFEPSHEYQEAVRKQRSTPTTATPRGTKRGRSGINPGLTSSYAPGTQEDLPGSNRPAPATMIQDEWATRELPPNFSAAGFQPYREYPAATTPATSTNASMQRPRTDNAPMTSAPQFRTSYPIINSWQPFATSYPTMTSSQQSHESQPTMTSWEQSPTSYPTINSSQQVHESQPAMISWQQSPTSYPTMTSSQQTHESQPTMISWQQSPTSYPTMTSSQQTHESQPTMTSWQQSPTSYPTMTSSQQTHESQPTMTSWEQSPTSYPTMTSWQQSLSSYPTMTSSQQAHESQPTMTSWQQPPMNYPTMTSWQQSHESQPTMTSWQQSLSSYPTMTSSQQAHESQPTMTSWQQPPMNYPTMTSSQQTHENQPTMTSWQQSPTSYPTMTSWQPGHESQPAMTSWQQFHTNNPTMTNLRPVSGAQNEVMRDYFQEPDNKPEQNIDPSQPTSIDQPGGLYLHATGGWIPTPQPFTGDV